MCKALFLAIQLVFIIAITEANVISRDPFDLSGLDPIPNAVIPDKLDDKFIFLETPSIKTEDEIYLTEYMQQTQAVTLQGNTDVLIFPPFNTPQLQPAYYRRQPLACKGAEILSFSLDTEFNSCRPVNSSQASRYYYTQVPTDSGIASYIVNTGCNSNCTTCGVAPASINDVSYGAICSKAADGHYNRQLLITPAASTLPGTVYDTFFDGKMIGGSTACAKAIQAKKPNEFLPLLNNTAFRRVFYQNKVCTWSIQDSTYVMFSSCGIYNTYASNDTECIGSPVNSSVSISTIIRDSSCIDGTYKYCVNQGIDDGYFPIVKTPSRWLELSICLRNQTSGTYSVGATNVFPLDVAINISSNFFLTFLFSKQPKF